MKEQKYSRIQNDSAGDVSCPVCGSQTVHHCPAPNWGEMRRCLSCGLVSANPMPLPESSASLFDKAYQGKVSASDMHQFATRLQLRDDLKSLQGRTRGWGKDVVIDWLKSNIPAGSVVLDIGCGTGLFLSELSRAGFRPLGLDVSESLVETLKKDGYQVWLGNVGGIPSDWPEPAASVKALSLAMFPPKSELRCNTITNGGPFGTVPELFFEKKQLIPILPGA